MTPPAPKLKIGDIVVAKNVTWEKQVQQVIVYSCVLRHDEWIYNRDRMDSFFESDILYTFKKM